MTASEAQPFDIRAGEPFQKVGKSHDRRAAYVGRF